MRLLAVGDVHIQPDNLSSVEEMKHKLIALIKENDHDLIILLGDILHTHETIHSDALNASHDFIHEVSITSNKNGKIPKCCVLIGNHDLINNQQFLTDRHAFNALKLWENVVIVDRRTDITIDGFKLIMLPYVPPGRFLEALGKDKWKDATAIFAHQEFYGCKMGSIKSEIGDKWKNKWPLIISGHIHDQQILNNVIYVGTPMQHGFGDSRKKTIGDFTFVKNKEYEYNKIDLGLPRKVTIALKLPIENLHKVEKKVCERNTIKVVINGTSQQFTAYKKSELYKELQKLANKVVFKAIKTQKIQLPEHVEEALKNESSDIKLEGAKFMDLLETLVKNENDATRGALQQVLQQLKQ